MKNKMIKIIAALICIMMLGAQALAEISLDSIFNDVLLPASMDSITVDSIQNIQSDRSNIITDATSSNIQKMYDSLYWAITYFDEDESYRDWAVPFMENDGQYLYIAYAPYLDGKIAGREATAWLVANYDISDIGYAVPSYTDGNMYMIISEFKPANGLPSFCENNYNSINVYGIRINSNNEIEFQPGSLVFDGENYKVSGEDFYFGSPVFTEDTKLIGIANGNGKVYSLFTLLCKALDKTPSAPIDAGTSVSQPVSATTAPAQVSDPVAVQVTAAPSTPSTPSTQSTPAATSTEEKEDFTKYYIIGGVAVVAVVLFVLRKKKAAKAQEAAAPGKPREPFVKAYTPAQTPAQPAAEAQTPSVTVVNPAENANNELKTIRLEPTVVSGIKCTAGVYVGAAYPIERKISMGIDPSRCGIIYKNERGISRLHCTLEPAGDGRLLLTDEGSSYGTFVNGEKLTPHVPRVLRDGESFYLADGRNAFVVFTEKR